MNQLRVLSLTTLILLSASRLPGQLVGSGSQIVACNEGTISFSVARAYRDLNFLSGYQWKFQGWYNVDPGKCNEIGQPEDYHNGGLLRKDSVTLLAFAFYDSTGTWGAVRVRDYPDSLFKPSNQQFCVPHAVFGYDRDSSGGDLPRECDGKQTGYQMIPASFEYTASGFPNKDGLVSMDKLHVKLDPSARAIPLGKQSSSQTSSNTPAPKPSGDSGNFLSKSDADAQNAKDRMLQVVREDVAAYIEASKTGFEAYKKGEAQMSQGFRRWDSSVKPLLANGCWVFQGATAANFTCVIPLNPDLNGARSFYTQISEDVTASLPRDWSPDAAPPFGGDLPSKGYRSSSGARGEVWLAHAESDGGYELHYELDTAPSTRSQQ